MHYVYAQDKQFTNISVQNCICTDCLHTHICTFSQLLQKKRKKNTVSVDMKLYYNGVFILQFKQNKNSNYQYHLLSLFDILFANILYEITYMCF